MTSPHTSTPSDCMVLERPITGKSLESVRAAVLKPGAASQPLVIRTWPELEKVFRGVPGFRTSEHYGEDETDDMVRGEIGRVGGFRIVIRWNGAPHKSPDGLFRSEVTGGRSNLCLDIEGHH